MIFDTRISGIPCQCAVTYYSAPRAMRVTGSGMGDCDPPEPGEFEYQILDRKGYKAAWLEKKMTKDDHERMYEEFNIETTGERFGYL